jgi:quercetin dioxygenase-like cupin family protein
MEPARPTPIVLLPDEGELLGESVIKAAGPELSLLEFEVAPGTEAKPHLHRRQSDAFYVLEGELEFLVGEETVQAGPGSFVLLPPGVVHGFRNVSGKRVRALNLHVPGGFAEYWRELAGLRSAGIEPDSVFFERHDVYDPD